MIFDADDTLWENNVLFERVIADFMDWLAHPTLDREQIREIFDEIEIANTRAHGYGSRVFLRSLSDCFAALGERPATVDQAREIESLATALLEHRVELMPDVASTLAELGSRHELYLMTKGAAEEQQRKIDASNLAHHFAGIHIVAEKDVAAYRRLVDVHHLEPTETWMIGNSPRSDIIPARRAGLNAVLIPNDNTWILEREEIDPHDDGILHLREFGQLRLHF